MDIRFHLILDWLEDYPVRHQLKDPSVHFSRPSILPEPARNLNSDYLYVCGIHDAENAARNNPGAIFICPTCRGDDRPVPSNIIMTEYPDSPGNLFLFLEDRFCQIRDWVARMQALVIQDASLQDLITLSEPIIGNTIDMSDSAFTLLATTYGIETDHEFTLLLRKYGFHPESTLQLMKKHDRFSAYESAGRDPIIFDRTDDFGPYPQVNRIFRFQNVYFTHAVMICDHKPLTPGLLDLFELLCDMLEIQVKREWDRRNNESNNSDIMIKSIIDGTLIEGTEIERRSAYFGLSPNAQYELTAVSTENDIGVYKTRFIREISELLPSSKVLLYKDLFLILSPVSPGSEKSSEMESPHLERFLKRNMASGGSSGVFTGLKNLPLAYRRASLALKYAPANCKGHEFIHPPGEPVPSVICHFPECFARCIAGESDQGELLWRNSLAGQALITLHSNDVAHNNNNLPLLYTYLLSGMSASYTASIFHMHRNNVPYRISRISSIINMDLTDEKVRFDLYMSYIMFEIYGP